MNALIRNMDAFVEVQVAAEGEHAGNAFLKADRPYHLSVRYWRPVSADGPSGADADSIQDLTVHVAASDAMWAHAVTEETRVDVPVGKKLSTRWLPSTWPGVGDNPGFVLVANRAETGTEQPMVTAQYRGFGPSRTAPPAVSIEYANNRLPNLGFSLYNIIVPSKDNKGVSSWRRTDDGSFSHRNYEVYELGGIYFIPRRSINHSPTYTPLGSSQLILNVAWSKTRNSAAPTTDNMTFATFHYVGDLQEVMTSQPTILKGAPDRRRQNAGGGGGGGDDDGDDSDDSDGGGNGGGRGGGRGGGEGADGADGAEGGGGGGGGGDSDSSSNFPDAFVSIDPEGARQRHEPDVPSREMGQLWNDRAVSL